MLIHIRGVDLPGDGGVRVGVQRRNRPDELLGLTDRCGDPLCAAVRPPVIQWSAGA